MTANSSKSRSALVAAGLGLLFACGADEAPEPEATVAETAPEPAAPEPEPPPAEPTLKPEAEARYGALALAPGFAPDPREQRGHAEGVVAASELAEGCDGFVGEAPLHTIEARGPFARLHLMVRGEAALGLVLRDPEGNVSCAPLPEGDALAQLEAHVAPGAHQLWISTAETADSVPYVLAISEMGLDADSMPAP